ncbi:hypothetical protein FACS1894142_6790 [Spirochaetia bacterium]|nr:hypothetical protein FACS1894142_6790 [Spirochaetia bacterium]
MIISASRRTDIPAFYGEWFMRRLREQRVLVRNPMNPEQISEIDLTPENIDGIVFWTKDPKRLLPHLDELDRLGYAYYFQFTLTPYDKTIEPHVADKSEIIKTFTELSDRIGKERVIWRYDPIILSDTLTVEHHADAFETLCEKLHAYTEKCVISFVDAYSFLNIQELSADACSLLAQKLSAIADAYGLPLASCCEKIDPAEYHIAHNKCIDDELINRIRGSIHKSAITYKKDRGQRKECGCAASRDIGAYNTCDHGCVYCYAKRGKHRGWYDPASPILCDAEHSPPCP